MKKIITLLIILICLLSSSVGLVEASVFPDVDYDHPNYDGIMYLYDNNIISGYEDGLFRPDGYLSRIELLKITMNAANIDLVVEPVHNFTDIERDSWYETYVHTALINGFINSSNINFNPYNLVTRAEVLKLAFNINRLKRNSIISNDPFLDVPKDSWFSPFVEKAKSKGYLVYDDSGFYNPYKPMRRSEVSELMYRILRDSNVEKGLVGSGRTYEGSGTYVLYGGDEVYDPLNNYYIRFNGLIARDTFKDDLSMQNFDSNHEKINLEYRIDIDLKSFFNRFDSRFRPDKLSDATLFPDGYYQLKNIEKLSDSKFKLNIELAMQFVYTRAVDDIEILYLPIYLSDTISKVENHETALEYVIKPAFEEIKAYLKTKQEQYLGKDIMDVDFTINDPIVLQETDGDYSHGIEDGVEKRFDLVRKYTKHNPENYDNIIFNFFTSKDEYFGGQAYYHQAYVAIFPYAVNESSSKDLLLSVRSRITDGMLHEIMHDFGMSDYGNNQGKSEGFIGDEYDGSNILCVVGLDCPEDKVLGHFQYIDDFVANEIGWSDRNKDGIIDVEQYGVRCSGDTEKTEFCREI